MKRTVLSVLLCLVGASAIGDEEKPNCKLTIRTFHKDGSAKVEIKEVHAATRADCKRLASEHQKVEDDDVSKITVATSFRR